MAVTVTVPDELEPHLRELAEHQYRTPEAQVLYLIRMATTRGRSQPPMDMQIKAAGPLFDALRDLRLKAGQPSTRAISRTILEQQNKHVSHTAVHEVLAGNRVPSWRALEPMILALGGNPAEFLDLWTQAKGQIL